MCEFQNKLHWCFLLSDLRLYKESSTKKATKKDWECVCITLNDWHLFLKQFRKSTNPQEREFFQYLGDKLFPLIEKQLEVRPPGIITKQDYEFKIRELLVHFLSKEVITSEITKQIHGFHRTKEMIYFFGLLWNLKQHK